MNLIIDRGNTRTKFALFQEQKLIDLSVFFTSDEDDCIHYVQNIEFESAILASTAKEDDKLLNILEKKSRKFIQITSETEFPIKIGYETKETLGDDRIAAVCGARAIEQEGDLLVITAGTCVTYNLLNKENSFLGGGISPGLVMRLKAMHEFTGKLPLLRNEEFDELLGQSTKESMLSGARKGIVAEIDGIIEEYQLLFPDLKVFICGGDTSFFVDRLKSKIFANSNLVLYGINEILNYNIKKI